MELHFIQANYTTINSWKRTLDFQILKDAVNRVVAENFALALETEVKYNKREKLEKIDI